MTYEMDIAGLQRELPLCRVTDDLYIGAFVMFGDVELTVHCAAELLKRAPEYDYIIAPEAKAIPLLYEMARQSGAEKYFLARKGAKAYMTGVFEVEVRSITTMHIQKLVIVFAVHIHRINFRLSSSGQYKDSDTVGYNLYDFI